MKKPCIILLFSLLGISSHAADLTWYDGHKGITYQVEGTASPVVGIALDLFKSDLRQVTGQQPQASSKGATIRIIQLDKASKSAISSLRKKNVPIDELQQKMDAFYLTVGDEITIVGNNGRGTAYGILELSRKAGSAPGYGGVTSLPKRKTS